MRALFYKNIGYSFIAQFIQLSLSVIITLFLPLLLGVEDFGYWQLFIFYTQYAGLFHLGIIDGVYLREGGKKYSDLNYTSIGFQQRILFFINLFFLLGFILLAFLAKVYNRAFVISLSGVLMLLSNTTNFYSVLLSGVNEIKTTSIGRMCYSLPFLIFVLSSFLFFHIDDYKPYIIAYIFCYSFYLLYCTSHSKEIVKAALSKGGWKYKNELIYNLKHGFILTIANITGMLILGITRFFIDNKWGIEVFGIVSYSLVVVNFVLMFISELSGVMYPELRSMERSVVDGYFTKTQKFLLQLTPLVLLAYYPISLLIDWLLPDYSDSARYMIYMLPVCVFEAKVMLQVNTYFKVYNMPKEMMISNIEALGFGLTLAAVSVYVFGSVTLAVIAMPITIVFQYFVSIKKLRKESYKNDLLGILPESLLIVFFVLINYYIDSRYIVILLFLVAVLVYYYYYRQQLKETIKRFFLNGKKINH